MDTVLILAGMPKSGSTSLRERLRRNAFSLRDHPSFTAVHDRGGPFVITNVGFSQPLVHGIETRRCQIPFAAVEKQRAMADLCVAHEERNFA